MNTFTETKSKEVSIPLGRISLEGKLVIPEQAIGLVLFSHGSGSGRFSPRNNWVADQLNQAGMATFLFDLLTSEEDEIYENRFDIDLLTARVVSVTEWIMKQEDTKDLKLAYFGASTGAASALNAAAMIGPSICSVVSRGGRPDLSASYLGGVHSPVLLIVGGLDTQVIELNEQAYRSLNCEKELRIVEGATHLFEEPGKLEEVAKFSAEWFIRHF